MRVDGASYSSKQYNGNPAVSYKYEVKYHKYSIAQKYFYFNLFLDGPDKNHSMIIRGDLFQGDNIAISVRYSEPDESMMPILNLEY